MKPFKNKERAVKHHTEISNLQDLFEKKIDEMFESLVVAVGSLKMKHNTNDKISRDILKRLFLIYIINSIYSRKFKKNTKVEIEKFLNKIPKPSLKDILEHAFSIFLADMQIIQMRNPSSFGSTFEIGTIDYIHCVLTYLSSALFNHIYNWSTEGTELDNIEKNHFSIWGIDFSES